MQWVMVFWYYSALFCFSLEENIKDDNDKEEQTWLSES